MSTVLSFGTRTIRLPSPDFDNSEQLDFDRINRRTRGGDLIIFRDNEWTHVATLKMRFSYMTQARVKALQQFLRDTIGLTVTLTDYEGFVWTGIILTPSAEVAQRGRFDFTAQLEFQGGR